MCHSWIWIVPTNVTKSLDFVRETITQLTLSPALQSSVHPFSQRKIDCNALSEIRDLSKVRKLHYLTQIGALTSDFCWSYSLLSVLCCDTLTIAQYSPSLCQPGEKGWMWEWGSSATKICFHGPRGHWHKPVTCVDLHSSCDDRPVHWFYESSVLVGLGISGRVGSRHSDHKIHRVS